MINFPSRSALIGLSYALAACANADTQCAANPAQELAHGGDRYAIDHMFFFTDGFAPELAYVEQRGFLRWPFYTTHTGQGTTGAFMRFDNFYIEFLWIDDAEAAAANTPRANSDFNERNTWRENPAISPFGIGMRDYCEDQPSEFEKNEYTAEWMGDRFSLYTTAGAQNSAEPWTFFLPVSITSNARESFGPQSASRLEHPSGARVLTGFRVILPEGQAPSETLLHMQEEGVIELGSGEAHLIELTFDEGAQGETVDLRPMSPLVLHF